MNGYSSKFPFQADGLTMREARRIFQLDPAPPPMDNINEYIAAAVKKNDLQYFLFFLHHFERRLNGRISSFLLREGLDRYEPERFLDYKQSCVLTMLVCLNRYDPGKSAEFATYVHHPIGNALLRCRMMEEGGSFSSLDEYKMARGIAWLYNESGKSGSEVISEFAKRENCSVETAEQSLTLARTNRSRDSFYVTAQDEDSEETGEDLTRDDSWAYAAILWNGTQADTVRTEFERITPCLENGKTAFVSCIESEEGAVGSTEYIVMRAKGINPYMVYLLARTDSFRQSAINSMTGSDGRQRAQVDKLKMLLYLKPSEQIIRLFAKYVEPTFLQVQKKNEQNIRLRQARDRLLPKLMSGELEV